MANVVDISKVVEELVSKKLQTYPKFFAELAKAPLEGMVKAVIGDLQDTVESFGLVTEIENILSNNIDLMRIEGEWHLAIFDGEVSVENLMMGSKLEREGTK